MSHVPARNARAYLGTGWSFPPTFSRIDDCVLMVSDERDVRESLWILFSTMLGERIMVPEYGTGLRRMVFHNITASAITGIRNLVHKAILRWEPRITVDEVAVQPDATVDGLVLITVYYSVRKTNARNNFVYPFYHREATTPVPGP